MRLEEPKGKILLVDDDENLRRAEERLLVRAGYVVETARDGREAAARLRDGGFDAIVTDIAMPELDGIGLLREARAVDLDLPVILVTANPAIESAAEAVHFGAFRYLLKPVDGEVLLREVRRATRLYHWAKLRRAAHAGVDVLQAGDRAGLDASFNRALEGMWMAYQPIVAFRSKKVFAFEALMRTSETTLPFPGAVIRAAERLDRFDDLGARTRALIGETLAAHPAPTIFVNLHVRELLDERLFDRAGALGSHAPRVVLEITERAALDEVADLRRRVLRLREMGFQIAIDDLGAGFAGLTSFAQLEPDIVKLDMSLVRDAHKEPLKQKLVASIASLCRDTSIGLVVEGVESVAERDVLVELGCDLMQGYLFARPARPLPDVTW